MTAVASSSAISTATAAAAAATSDDSSDDGTPILGKDDFLKLLVTQMQNQDPLDPTDDTAFVAQLAQFSSVEQMTNVNDTLTQMLTAQAGANQLQATSLVGKSVEANSNTVTLGSSGPVALGGTLSGAAANVTATITDSNGNVVRTIQCGPAATGNWTGSWDGNSDSGNAEPPGTYTVSLSAVDSSGNAVTAASTVTGIVTGVSFSTGAAQLVINGTDVAMSNVVEIDQPPSH